MNIAFNSQHVNFAACFLFKMPVSWDIDLYSRLAFVMYISLGAVARGHINECLAKALLWQTMVVINLNL